MSVNEVSNQASLEYEDKVEKMVEFLGTVAGPGGPPPKTDLRHSAVAALAAIGVVDPLARAAASMVDDDVDMLQVSDSGGSGKKKTRPAMAPSARIPLRQGDLDGHFVVHSDMGRFP